MTSKDNRPTDAIPKVDEALLDSENLYRELFELSSDAVLLIAIETGNIIDANTMASIMYGYSLKELLAKKSTDLSAEPIETTRRMQESKASPSQIFKIPERLHRKKDGTVFPVDITARSFVRNGQSFLLVSSRDITERKRAEVALQENRERYHALFTQAGDGIFILDFDGKILSINVEFARMHGYTVEEMLAMGIKGLDVEGIAPMPERMRRIMAGETLSFEVDPDLRHNN